jgi:endonuclease/exonuclease/phosphatase family metal-dependent hydrolase
MHGVALVAILACVVFSTAVAQDAGLSVASSMHGERGARPAPSDTVARGSDVVRIMTWNIRYNNPGDGIHAWEKRRDALLSYVLSRKPDILCIQEGLNDQVAFLKEGLRGFDMRGVGRDDGKTKGEYSAIYFDTARFDLLDYGTFWLSPTSDVPGKGWDAALPRIVTWVRLADSSAARTFFVFNTHFDHQGVEARGKSAELLRRKIGEIARRSPAIVAGDFNAAETDPPYLILTSPDLPGPRLEDAQLSSLSPHEGPRATFTGFELKDPDPGERIDYLFVTRSLQVLSHTTCDARRKEGFLSDHLPVVADIALFPRP